MLSSSSVFLILLGVFVAFCMFSHVKRRYTEGFTEAPDVKTDENAELDLAASQSQTFDRPDYKELKGQTNPRKIKPTTQPTFMKTKVSFKEGFTKSSLGDWAMNTAKEGMGLPYNCKTAAGVTTQSQYGCCPDGTPFAYQGGANCTQPNHCSYGLCDNSSECKSDVAGTNCGKNASFATKMPTGTPGSTMTPASYPTNLPQTCAGSLYGCCPDNKTVSNADKSNCFANGLDNGLTPSDKNNMGPGLLSYNTSTVLIPPPVGFASVPTEPSPAEAGVATEAEAVPTEATPVQNCTPTESPAPPSVSLNCPAAPPCPACARCPEPSFECKKVPNYKVDNNQRFLPQAVLTDFSSFGM